MFVEINEIKSRTGRLAPLGSGRFTVSVGVQQAMLGAFLNVSADALAAGMPAAGLPEVRLTYTKVTKAKARMGGVDYREIPGASFDSHLGRPVKVARNKAGAVYFTLVDANRDEGSRAGFTAVKLEGIRSFMFADPSIQRAFEDKARQAVGASS